MEYYEKIPQETSELYKRYYINIPFDLRKFESNSESSEIRVENSVKEWENNLGIRFDVAMNSNEHISKPGEFVKVVDTIEDSRLHKSSEDKYVAYINARSNKSISLDIPDGKSAAVNILFMNSNRPLNSKVIIKVGKGSKLSVFEYYGSSADTNTSLGTIHEIYSEDDSELELNALHNEDSNTVCISNCRNEAGKNAHIRINSMYNGSSHTRVRNVIEAGKENGKVEVNEMVFGSHAQKFDISTYIVNAAQRTNASLESKAALMDTSFCILKGFAKINKGAKKSKSYVHERGILLDKGAKVDGLPDMAVDENDVRATHSSATAPIDQESVFYLKTRGMGDKEVKSLLVTGFFISGIAKIHNNVMKGISMSVINDKLENGTYGSMPKFNTRNIWVGSARQENIDMFRGHYKYRGK